MKGLILPIFGASFTMENIILEDEWKRGDKEFIDEFCDLMDEDYAEEVRVRLHDIITFTDWREIARLREEIYFIAKEPEKPRHRTDLMT